MRPLTWFCTGPLLVLACALFLPPGLTAAPWAAAMAEPGARIDPAAATVPFLGLPYRPDGALNKNGEYVLFNAPDVPLPSPGLNCSGFVLAVSRLVLGRNITISEAVRDRLGDSRPGSPDGQDWDFGFDLIMNISEGENRALVAPVGPLSFFPLSDPAISGKTVPSWDIHSTAFAEEFLPRVQPGRLYLASFSRRRAPDAPPRLHYHTAVIVRDGSAVWLYGTTRTSGRVIRLNMADPKGLAAFRAGFRNAANSLKRLTVIEVTPNRPAPLPLPSGSAQE